MVLAAGMRRRPQAPLQQRRHQVFPTRLLSHQPNPTRRLSRHPTPLRLCCWGCAARAAPAAAATSARN